PPPRRGVAPPARSRRTPTGPQSRPRRRVGPSRAARASRTTAPGRERVVRGVVGHHRSIARGWVLGCRVARTNRLAELMRRERVLRAAVVARDYSEVVIADPELRAAALRLERERRRRRVGRLARAEHV